jgi:hypothetical protein
MDYILQPNGLGVKYIITKIMVAGSVQKERRKRRFLTSKNLETACRLHGGLILCGGQGDDLKRIAGSAENFLGSRVVKPFKNGYNFLCDKGQQVLQAFPNLGEEIPSVDTLVCSRFARFGCGCFDRTAT